MAARSSPDKELIGTGFRHRTSQAGDPQLHTHNASSESHDCRAELRVILGSRWPSNPRRLRPSVHPQQRHTGALSPFHRLYSTVRASPLKAVDHGTAWDAGNGETRTQTGTPRFSVVLP
jgi:hypothetical protein